MRRCGAAIPEFLLSGLVGRDRYGRAYVGTSLETPVERLGGLGDARLRQICRALEIAVAGES